MNTDHRQSSATGTMHGERGRSRRLGEMLCERGLITDDQLAAALKYQKESGCGKRLGLILIEANVVTAEDVVRTLSELVATPYMTLTHDMVQPEAVRCLPPEYLEKHNLLPLSLIDGRLTIAIEDFTDVFLPEDIGRRVNGDVIPISATPENIRKVRQQVLQSAPVPAARLKDEESDGLRRILEQIGVDELKIVEYEQQETEADLVAFATDSPVVKLVNYVIKCAVEMRASDIHIEPEDGTFRIRYRVDGELMETIRPASSLLSSVVSRIKIMAGMDISERRKPQDGGVTVTLADRPIDLRVSTMPTRSGEKAVLRLVDREAGVQGLDTLGFEPVLLAEFRSIMQEPTGLVLVSGPTGSGKTTTLYGALKEIISDKINISTIEDPVERRLAGTNQFQIHPQAGFTFASALRSMIRQDPDVIMVGEIRDTETASLATEAALTGHLVLSTLHTNDAPSAVPRLVNMGVEPYLVAASLRAVLAQRLVRRLCTHCRRITSIGDADRETLSQLCGGQPSLATVHTAKGCSRCHDTGSFGRIGIFELLRLNEAMLSGIIRDPTMQGVRAAARNAGYTTLLQDGLCKVSQGTIGVSSLLELASHAEPTTPHDFTVRIAAA